MASQSQPPGVRCKIQKENHKYRMGWGDSINQGLQEQALLTVSHLHPEFSKIQIVKVYDPSGSQK